MAKGNKDFEALLQRFHEKGWMKEVYRTERALVCNVFNQYYLAFPLDILDRFQDDFPGYVINSKGLKTIVEDDTYVLWHYQALSKEMQDRSFAVVNEALFDHWVKNADDYQQRAKTPKVDLEFEREVLEKGREALPQKPQKGLFGFLKRK